MFFYFVQRLLHSFPGKLSTWLLLLSFVTPFDRVTFDFTQNDLFIFLYSNINHVSHAKLKSGLDLCF